MLSEEQTWSHQKGVNDQMLHSEKPRAFLLTTLTTKYTVAMMKFQTASKLGQSSLDLL